MKKKSNDTNSEPKNQPLKLVYLITIELVLTLPQLNFSLKMIMKRLFTSLLPRFQKLTLLLVLVSSLVITPSQAFLHVQYIFEVFFPQSLYYI